jgi:Glycosyltransferase 61
MKFYIKDNAKRLLLKSSALFCKPLDRHKTRSLPFLEQLLETKNFQLNTLRINGVETKTQEEIVYPETKLFKAISSDSVPLSILPSGGVCNGDRILHTGFDGYYNTLGYFQSFFKDKREVSGTIVANWPQRFLTYGDFVLQLLPELCAIKSLVTPEEWSNTSFILGHAPKFLFEYLNILGCNNSQVIDSRQYHHQLLPQSQVYFREKDTMWFLCAPPELIQIARNYLIPPQIGKGAKIIFVERLGGYRQAIGLTDSVRSRLKDLGVSFFDPARASVQTQIETFAAAKIVLGIHGAGLANIMWCQPDTKVIEIFHPKFAPWCYAILANQLGMDYYCLGRQPGLMEIDSRAANVPVDWEYLIALVEKLTSSI